MRLSPLLGLLLLASPAGAGTTIDVDRFRDAVPSITDVRPIALSEAQKSPPPRLQMKRTLMREWVEASVQEVSSELQVRFLSTEEWDPEIRYPLPQGWEGPYHRIDENGDLLVWEDLCAYKDLVPIVCRGTIDKLVRQAHLDRLQWLRSAESPVVRPKTN